MPCGSCQWEKVRTGKQAQNYCSHLRNSIELTFPSLLHCLVSEPWSLSSTMPCWNSVHTFLPPWLLGSNVEASQSNLVITISLHNTSFSTEWQMPDTSTAAQDVHKWFHLCNATCLLCTLQGSAITCSPAAFHPSCCVSLSPFSFLHCCLGLPLESFSRFS